MFNYMAVCLLKTRITYFFIVFLSENGRFFRVFSVLVKLTLTPHQLLQSAGYLNLSHPIIFPTFL